MENFLFISPDFPKIYENFPHRLKAVGFNVIAIGATPYHSLSQKLKESLSEYYYCPDLNDYNSVYKAIAFLIFKHGRIKYLESNNEHWLENDARLRQDFNIEGLHPSDLVAIKHKSKMKEYYRKAGVKCVSYALVDKEEDFDDFLEDFGYPLFIKPDVGVGASDSFKINSDLDKKNFFATKKQLTYIVEPFVDGLITSFDALVDASGQVVFATSHIFPVANHEIAQGVSDDYYFSTPKVDPQLYDIGQRVINAFKIKKRAVHLEFFKLNADTSYGKKDEYIGLEVNMRSPGGYMPEMISSASNVDYYDIYARIMMGLEVIIDENRPTHFGLEVSRRKEFLDTYRYTNEEIIAIYQNIIIDHGLYPEILAAGMGDFYFVGLFNQLEAALTFKNSVLERKL